MAGCEVPSIGPGFTLSPRPDEQSEMKQASGTYTHLSYGSSQNVLRMVDDRVGPYYSPGRRWLGRSAFDLSALPFYRHSIVYFAPSIYMGPGRALQFYGAPFIIVGQLHP